MKFCWSNYQGVRAYLFVFFFNDTATTEIYTLSLHDALPICCAELVTYNAPPSNSPLALTRVRSEEHTSELQSLRHLVCRLLLETKNTARKDERKHDKKQTNHGAGKESRKK